jgi:hypothetical protein
MRLDVYSEFTYSIFIFTDSYNRVEKITHAKIPTNKSKKKVKYTRIITR